MSIAAKKMVLVTPILLNKSESPLVGARVDLQQKQQNRGRLSWNCILRRIGTALAFQTITEADDGVVGPGIRMNSAGV